MSSALERRHALTLSLNITFWFSLILIVYSAGIYLLSYHLLDESLEEDWDFTHRKTVYAGVGEEMELRIEEQFGRTKLNEAMRSYIGRHFRRTWFLTMVPLVLLALAGGFGLTYYATRPGRRVVATVEAILETGDLSRRVSLTASGMSPFAKTSFAKLIDLSYSSKSTSKPFDSINSRNPSTSSTMSVISS